MIVSAEVREVHRQGVVATLAKLKSVRHDTVELGRDSLLELLQELFDLRWQNRGLQERGTALLMENRRLKKKLGVE